MVNCISITLIRELHQNRYLLIYYFQHSNHEVKVLLAEDEADVLNLYRAALERRGHAVVVALDGEQGLRAYHDSLKQEGSRNAMTKVSGFDVVVLDYRMPRKDGMQVAKAILALVPDQRIIFASAYVKDTLVESVKKLDRIVELIQKPFELKQLVDTIEDTEVYGKLKQFNVNIERIRGLNLSHDELEELTERVGEIMKQKFSA